MVYIFNLCCLISSLISCWAVVCFWQNYKRTGFFLFKSLSLAFFFISLALLLLFLPKLVLLNPFWVQVDFILVDLSFLAGALFVTSVTLSFSKKFLWFREHILRILLFTLLIYVILNILFFAPAVPLFLDGTLCYFKNGVFWLHSILWLSLTSFAGIFGGGFLNGIKKIKEKKLFLKGLIVGVASILVSVAGILFWYFKFFNPSLVILNISGSVAIFGFILGLINSVFFPPSREILVKKIT